MCDHDEDDPILVNGNSSPLFSPPEICKRMKLFGLMYSWKYDYSGKECGYMVVGDYAVLFSARTLSI
jgi:hypothetical protein